MILAYIFCLGVGAASLLVTSKLSMVVRFGIAIAIAVVLAVVVTLLLQRIGDRAPADAVTIVPKPSEAKK